MANASMAKDLIDTRLEEYNKAPENTLDWDEVCKQLNKENLTG